MPGHRIHSTGFKRQVVAEYHGGETLHALGRRHDLSKATSDRFVRLTSHPTELPS